MLHFCRTLLNVDPQARIDTAPPTGKVKVDSALDENAFLAALSAAGYPNKQGAAAQREI